MNETRNRFTSWALWLSVIGAVWTILEAFGVPERYGMTHETWATMFNAVGAILIAFGIVNNPTNPEGL